MFLGGYFLGTGVDISNLYNFGYSPLLILVLMMSVSGSARYAANIFVSFAGKSPGTVALFVLSRDNKSHTRAGSTCGISSGE